MGFSHFGDVGPSTFAQCRRPHSNKSDIVKRFVYDLWFLSGCWASCQWHLWFYDMRNMFKYSPCLFRWIVDMEGAPGTLYEGEKFQLLFKFSSRYPFDSPQVSARGSAVLLRTQSSFLFFVYSFHSFTQANRSVPSKIKFPNWI